MSRRALSVIFSSFGHELGLGFALFAADNTAEGSSVYGAEYSALVETMGFAVNLAVFVLLLFCTG